MWDSLLGEENSPRLFTRALNSSVVPNQTTHLRQRAWNPAPCWFPLAVTLALHWGSSHVLHTQYSARDSGRPSLLYTASPSGSSSTCPHSHLQLWESAETASLISKVIIYTSHSGVFRATNRRTEGVSRTRGTEWKLFQFSWDKMSNFFLGLVHTPFHLYFLSLSIFLLCFALSFSIICLIKNL